MNDGALFGFGLFLLGGLAGFWLPRGGPSDYERGRCVGWADAQGLVPAWDADGRCVLGDYPADGAESAEETTP